MNKWVNFMQSPKEIYNELRERVAYAFEIQVQEFVDDEKLHKITMDMFSHVLGLKVSDSIEDYRIHVNKFNESTYYTSISILPKHDNQEEFLANVMMAMQIFLQQQPDDKDPGSYEFKLQLNKKSVTIKLVQK